jgi:hypothetical protein
MTMIGLRTKGGAPDGASAQEVATFHYRAALAGAFGSWRDTFVKPLRMFPPDDLSNPLGPWWKRARAMTPQVSGYAFAQTLEDSPEATTLEFSRLDQHGAPQSETVTIRLVLEEDAWRVERAQY